MRWLDWKMAVVFLLAFVNWTWFQYWEDIAGSLYVDIHGVGVLQQHVVQSENFDTENIPPHEKAKITIFLTRVLFSRDP